MWGLQGGLWLLWGLQGGLWLLWGLQGGLWLLWGLRLQLLCARLLLWASLLLLQLWQRGVWFVWLLPVQLLQTLLLPAQLPTLPTPKGACHSRRPLQSRQYLDSVHRAGHEVGV